MGDFKSLRRPDERTNPEVDCVYIGRERAEMGQERFSGGVPGGRPGPGARLGAPSRVCLGGKVVKTGFSVFGGVWECAGGFGGGVSRCPLARCIGCLSKSASRSQKAVIFAELGSLEDRGGRKGGLSYGEASWGPPLSRHSAVYIGGPPGRGFGPPGGGARAVWEGSGGVWRGGRGVLGGRRRAGKRRVGFRWCRSPPSGAPKRRKS